jgi:hypothetical protein
MDLVYYVYTSITNARWRMLSPDFNNSPTTVGAENLVPLSRSVFEIQWCYVLNHEVML